MLNGGIKRGRDYIYDAVKAQFCDITDEDRSTLKTPQTSCIHCHTGQTRNTSEMHWHLCVCHSFGMKDSSLQNMLRTCVPDSLLRSQKKKKMFHSWHSNPAEAEEAGNDPSKSQGENATKKKRNVAGSREETLSSALSRLIGTWVYMYKVPVAAVEAPEFRDIIKLLNSDIKNFPGKDSLSRELVESVYQQTSAQVAETLSKAESLQVQLPLDFSRSDGSSSSSAPAESSPPYIHVYDGRGTFYYQLPQESPSGAYASTATLAQRVVEAARAVLELPNATVVSAMKNTDNYTEEAVAHARELLHACEVQYPQKIYIPSQPFSPEACAQYIVSSVGPFSQVVSHAQCLVQYFQHASAPGSILRNIVGRSQASASSAVGLAFEFTLPGEYSNTCLFSFVSSSFNEITSFLLVFAEQNSVQSVCEMLETVSNAQQAGLFNRLLADGAYQNYFHTLTDSVASQEAALVQSILVSEAAMTGIEQAAFTLQLLLAAASKSARPHSATYSDSLALRDGLIGAVNKTSFLSHPWKLMVAQVIAGEWDKSHHMIVALACKLDPRRKFADLPSAMEADAQRVRDQLLAHVDPSVRKAVLDSWVLMMKREEAFGSSFALENAHAQNPKDWWIAHTAGHKELRELVAFPALSALGIPLEPDNVLSEHDPRLAGLTALADSESLVLTAGLDATILESADLVSKLSYIRHNSWCLHHARARAQNASLKHQSRLLTSDDLSIYNYDAQLMSNAVTMHPASHPPSHPPSHPSSHPSSHSSLHSSHAASHPHPHAAVAVYGSHLDNNNYEHFGHMREHHSSGPVDQGHLRHAQSSSVASAPQSQYVALHSSTGSDGSTSQQVLTQHQQQQQHEQQQRNEDAY